jgi:hypothetical protein
MTNTSTPESSFEEWATHGPVGSKSPDDEYTKMRAESGDAVTVEIKETPDGHSCIEWDGDWLYYDPHAFADEVPWKPYREIDAAVLSFRRHPDDK